MSLTAPSLTAAAFGSPPARPDLEMVLGAEAPADAGGAAVRSIAVHSGLRADRATRLRAMVEELLREAREREFANGDDEIRICALRHGDQLRVEIHDRRLPLVPGASRSLPSRRLAALGFVDRLHIVADGDAGNLAVCEIRLGDPDGAEVEGVEVLAHDVERVSDEVASQLEIREMVPADAAGIARCVYRCYGYTYLDPSLYQPRVLRRAVRSGQLHPVVAVTPSGEVVGHCALTFDRPGDLVPEGGKLVVDPRYRGHHLAERLAGVRARVAENLGVAGIWFECVTNHAFSQKEVLSGGGAETGLLLGATPTSIAMEGLGNSHGGRHALLTMWSPVAGTTSSTVHVPTRHADLVATICERLGLDRRVECGTATRPVTPRRSRLTSSVCNDTGVVHVRVLHIGADLVDRVADELDGLAEFDVASVLVDVPVGDPAAIGAIQDLERLELFWGAWLPGFTHDGGDALRLQRVSDQSIELEGISCARPEGEQLRDMVLSEWHRVRRGGAG